MGDQSLV